MVDYKFLLSKINDQLLQPKNPQRLLEQRIIKKYFTLEIIFVSPNFFKISTRAVWHDKSILSMILVQNDYQI